MNQYFGQFFPSNSGACSFIGYLLATQGIPRRAIKCQLLLTGPAPQALWFLKTVHSIDEQYSEECFGRYAYAEKAPENLHLTTAFGTCRISGKSQLP